MLCCPQSYVFSSGLLGELPPPVPRACFGRGELIEEAVGLAENLTPIALIGAGGIGKTSVALTVLHHTRIKQRFGQNRRFIRCDQFPATLPRFLSQLSKVTGAGVENAKDLATLLPFLSSKEILIVLDNAESILDPQGTDSREIYAAVEELCRVETACLCITSRISTIPPDCETFDIPALPIESAREVFYRIFKSRGRDDSVEGVLRQLDGHPLSITLLATVAYQNKWDNNRLVREWKQRQTGILQTGHNKSLAGTIELSLASPMFKGLGPDARGLLEVVAFFPQGVDENNLDWLFPTITNGSTLLDTFCILSLTYRNNGFITMLAPLRDYLSPKDPMSSPLLCKTKECYFARMSIEFDYSTPAFREARWIASEDVNVEHLLHVFTSIDTNSDDTWNACGDFMGHLHWHKPRLTILGPKVEGLSDDHPSKPLCLFRLSLLFNVVGHDVERKWVLNHALKLWRERGEEGWIVSTLEELSDANRMLGLCTEGIQHAKEALEINQRLGNTSQQAISSRHLAWLLFEDGQLDVAEEVASRAVGLLPEKGLELSVCETHRVLGHIYRSRGEKKKAAYNYEVALGIASPFQWRDQLFWIHHALGQLFSDEDEFDDAHVHIEHAKSHTADGTYSLGRAMELEARIWYRQRRLEEARSGAQRALETYERLGAENDVEECRVLLRDIESGFDGKLSGMMLLCTPVNSPSLSTQLLRLPPLSPLFRAEIAGFWLS
jgi:tetratricopeptide (TPR) repeat protein